MLYREHRGSLEDSMKTIFSIKSTKKDLSQIIGCNIEDIEVKEYGYDDRIGWNTFIVLVKGIPVGFTDGDVNEEN